MQYGVIWWSVLRQFFVVTPDTAPQVAARLRKLNHFVTFCGDPAVTFGSTAPFPAVLRGCRPSIGDRKCAVGLSVATSLTVYGRARNDGTAATGRPDTSVPSHR